MSTASDVVVVVGERDLVAVPLAEVHLSVADLSATRGDGVFESIGFLSGAPLQLEPHLARLARSAAMLDLPVPDLVRIRHAVALAVASHAPAPELLAKIVVSRGIEGTGVPTCWVHVFAGADHAAARRSGIRVVTLDRGTRSDVASTSPWLLQGAKTLSYATNTAALREAARRGADDVVFTSTDGLVLEGPTSNVLVRVGDTLRTPPPELGILHGTTQRALFAAAERLGLRTEYTGLRAADLGDADALWLASSGRLLAPVRELDGAAMPVDRALTVSLSRTAFGIAV